MATANLLAASYGLVELPTNGRDPATGEEFDTFVPADHAWRDARTLEAALAGFEPPGWSPSAEKIKAEEDEEDEKAGGGGAGASGGLEESTQKLLALLDELAAIDVAGCAARAHDFEKDLDPNFHIDFVAAAANLRARNYGIKEAGRHKVKMIAGKIIPAIATSTACATALMCIELLKLVQGKPKGAFRNSSNNFAINSFQMSEPLAARTVRGAHVEEEMPDPADLDAFDAQGKVRPESIKRKRWVAIPDPHTKWDRITLPAGCTLNAMIETLRAAHGLVVTGWTALVPGEDGKPTGITLYRKEVQVAGLDEELLVRVAPLDLDKQKATMALMRSKEIPGNMKQNYITKWAKLREGGKADGPLSAMLEAKAGSLKGRASVELMLNLENEAGDEARTPPVILTL